MTDYIDLFRRAKKQQISVIIQNRNPAPQCIGSRNIYLEDKGMIHSAAKEIGYSLRRVNKDVAIFAMD